MTSATAPPDLAAITSVEDCTPLIAAADHRRRALLDRSGNVESWTETAEVCEHLALLYARAMTLAAITHPPCVYYAARDAAHHWITQGALARQRARQAEERGW